MKRKRLPLHSGRVEDTPTLGEIAKKLQTPVPHIVWSEFWEDGFSIFHFPCFRSILIVPKEKVARENKETLAWIVAHELAHVKLRHYSLDRNTKNECEADTLASAVTSRHVGLMRLRQVYFCEMELVEKLGYPIDDAIKKALESAERTDDEITQFVREMKARIRNLEQLPENVCAPQE